MVFRGNINHLCLKLFFFIAGIILQVWLTKDGIYHEEQFPPIKRRRNKHETREERKQRKYRYLYQVSLFPIFVHKNKSLGEFCLLF